MSILPLPPFDIRSIFVRTLPAQPCLLCGDRSRQIWCAACDATLPYLGAAHCPVCALPAPGGATCGQCLKEAPHFDRTVAAFGYAFPVNRLAQALKYSGQLNLAYALADKLATRIAALPDIIIPMPLHPARLRERGFNQSLELARRLATRLGVPLLPHACRRVRDTPPQATLSYKERDKNVRKAFVCDRDFSGKHVAMVDDVMTSGASLNELAAALRRAGAREISAWVAARTLRHEH